MNVLLDLKTALSPELIAKIAEYTREKPEPTKSALDILFPTLMAGLLKRTSNEMGTNLVFSLLQKERLNGTLTQSLKDMAKNPASIDETVKMGSSLFSRMLPDKKSSITNMVAHQAGIRASSSISLLGFATPLLMDAIGKIAQDQKLDATELALQIASQKDYLVENTPKPILDKMADILGINNLGNLGAVPEVVAPTTSKREVSPEKTSYSKPSISVQDLNNEGGFNIPTRWLLIGAGVVLVGILAWFAWSKFASPSNQTTAEEVVANGADSTAATAADTTTKPKPAPITVTNGSTLPDGQTLSAKEGSLPYDLSKYLADTSAAAGKQFVFKGIGFVPGSFSLNPDSEKEVEDLAKVLKAYPSAQLKITGYVRDSVQSKAVSFKRANALKLSLMAKGVDLMRLDAVGKGRGSQSLIEVRVIKR